MDMKWILNGYEMDITWIGQGCDMDMPQICMTLELVDESQKYVFIGSD